MHSLHFSILRLVIWASIGIVLAQMGYSYDTAQFWCIVVLVFLLEYVNNQDWIETVRHHIKEKIRELEDR